MRGALRKGLLLQRLFVRSGPPGARGKEGVPFMLTDWELIEAAREARKNAYCPYSGFAVGAALLARSGRVYRGANCENVSFGGTICAERAALAAALTAGERRFLTLAVAAGDAPVAPCGLCRQMLAEFGELRILRAAAQGDEYRETTLSTLLPEAFTAYRPDEREPADKEKGGRGPYEQAR